MTWKIQPHGIGPIVDMCLVARMLGQRYADRRISSTQLFLRNPKKRPNYEASGRNRALIVGVFAMVILLPVVLGHDVLPVPDIIPYVYWAYLTALILTVPIACLGAFAAQRTEQKKQDQTATS